MPQLRMIWKDRIPAPVHLKTGCYIIDRTTTQFTKEQLADGWIDACTELTGGTPWTREQFFRDHWDDPKIPQDGVYFAVTQEGRIFSTATVQVLEGHIGNLHMVGTAQDCKGMGGGRAVCTAVVEYFRRHEIKTAFLDTDDFRIPAIKIYLGLGYRPYLYTDGMAERWHRLMDQLGLDVLEAYDVDLSDQVMFSKVFTDRPQR